MFRRLFSAICNLLRRARFASAPGQQRTGKQRLLVKPANSSTKKKNAAVKKIIAKQRCEQCAVMVRNGPRKVWSTNCGAFVLELQNRTSFPSSGHLENDEMQSRPARKRGRDWGPGEERPRKRRRTEQAMKLPNTRAGQAGKVSNAALKPHLGRCFAPYIHSSENAFVGSTTSPVGDLLAWKYNPPELRYQD